MQLVNTWHIGLAAENVHVPFLVLRSRTRFVPAVARFQRLTIGLRSPLLVMLLGFGTWRVNQSYAVDLQLRLLLQRGVAVRYVALVIIAAVLSSFRMYLGSSGFHIGIA